MATSAGAGELGACSVPKGLYEDWVTAHTNPRGTLSFASRRSSAATPEPEKEQAVGARYQAFFQCLADNTQKAGAIDGPALCEQAAGDRLASLVCQTVVYLKNGRKDNRDFIDALPIGKKAGEMISDLDNIVSVGEGKGRMASIFLPDGPALKVVDELFLLVLDDTAGSAAKYFSLSGSASDALAEHMDKQIQLLLRESPSVVVKEWPAIRQYQAKLKKLLADMEASLPAGEMLNMRRGIAGFCTKDNLDCPEILKVVGRPN